MQLMPKHMATPSDRVVCYGIRGLAGTRLKTGIVKLALVALVLTVTAPGTAQAQSASCAQLNATLSTLSNNKDFRVLNVNQNKARELAGQIRNAESVFVRGGCQTLLNKSQKLTAECMRVARVIVKGRDDYAKLSASIETGQAVSQQREVALQQIARFGCNAGTNTTYNSQSEIKSPFARLFEQLFGGGQQVLDPYGYNPNGQTLRTVCVRSCDGYYWPISFSTVPEFLADDNATCQSQCPGSDVELYYYHNPGETPEDMINLAGAPYSSLPDAFRYRQEYDSSCSCKAPVTYGRIEVATIGGSSPGRAMVAYDDLDFPLPLRDPRQQTRVVEVAAIHVPLPRPRPVQPGEQGPATSPTPVETAASGDMQLLKFGDRVVRLVGPVTPYARSVAAGS